MMADQEDSGVGEKETAIGVQYSGSASASLAVQGNGSTLRTQADTVTGNGAQALGCEPASTLGSSAKFSTPTHQSNLDVGDKTQRDLLNQIIDGTFFGRTGCDTVLEKRREVTGTNQTNWSTIGGAGPHTEGVRLPFQANSASFISSPYGNAYAGSHPLRAPSTASTASSALSSAHVAARHVISKDLPIFSGKSEEWLLFISNYEQSTERCGFSNEENLIRLQKCLRGSALDAVRGKLMIPATVPYAIGTLRMLYGRAEIVHAALQRKLRDEPAIKQSNLDSVIRLALAVQNYCATLAAVGLSDYLNDPALLSELVAKMPSDLKLDWGRHRLSIGGGSLATFDNWLFNIAMCASMVTSYEPQQGESSRSGTRQQRILVHDVVTNNGSDKSLNKDHHMDNRSCPECNGEHRLSECNRFRALDVKKRWDLVKRKGLCFCCLLQHLLRNCRQKKKCGVDGCTSVHNVLLHSAEPMRGNTDVKPTKVGESVLFHGGTATKALFRYVPVTLHGKARNVHTFALIDEGAACSLMESALADELELDGPESELCLRWTGDVTQTEPNSKAVCVSISAAGYATQRYVLNGVRTAQCLDLPVQSVESQMLHQRDHLKSVPIQPYKDVKAQLIIGLDNIKVSVPLELREAENDDIVAVRCKLGWAVYGSHGIEGAAAQLGTHQLDEAIKAYFSVESIGVKALAKPIRSKEDDRALLIMEATTTYLPSERRWQTGLLWRFDKVELPDSYSMALKRLKCVETKMAKDSRMREWFTGPKFPLLDEPQWPFMDMTAGRSCASVLCHAEEKTVHVSMLACITPDSLRFSTLERLRTAQRRVLEPHGELLRSLLQLKLDHEMDIVSIRVCQAEAFYKEIVCLQSGRRLTDRKNILFKCSPYLDGLGVLRVRGQIDAIEGVEVDVKRPIILPRRHRVTYLVAELYHRKYHHLHSEIAVNELRQRYWICGLRALVRGVLRAYPRCRMRRARPEPREIADLPT